jgi:hypothetical protein
VEGLGRLITSILQPRYCNQILRYRQGAYSQAGLLPIHHQRVRGARPPVDAPPASSRMTRLADYSA